uniref:WGS project CBME000000000 data, contig CS3487_c001355 n=1 Tax=Fusarium pseudograminearum CS3487 TaxID=1318458 RepID=A0A096PE95_FUSPS|nr:unnamed protein product [Fusarium pseudograminearum CS3487]
MDWGTWATYWGLVTMTQHIFVDCLAGMQKPVVVMVATGNRKRRGPIPDGYVHWIVYLFVFTVKIVEIGSNGLRGVSN